MTREKRYLLSKIEEIDRWENNDLEMDGSGELGEVIENHYDEIRKPYLERLNELMHGHLEDFFTGRYWYEAMEAKGWRF